MNWHLSLNWAFEPWIAVETTLLLLYQDPDECFQVIISGLLTSTVARSGSELLNSLRAGDGNTPTHKR